MVIKYAGLSAADMLFNPTLTKEIIARHNDHESDLDTDQLAHLDQLVNDLSRVSIILESKGLSTEPKNSGSLVAYAISLHGAQGIDSPPSVPNDISCLKEWFASDVEKKA